MAERVISPPEVSQTSPLEHSRRQLEALLEVSEAIAQQRDLTALFHDLAVRLHSVIEFDFLSLVLHDTAKNVMRLHVLETHLPSAKRSEEHTSELQSRVDLVCRLLLEKKKNNLSNAS